MSIERFDVDSHDLETNDESGEFMRFEDHERALALRELEKEVLAALDAVSTSSLVWHQHSGPFRHVCRATLRLREARKA